MMSTPSVSGSRKLQLSDISDLRAYERERASYRERLIELKRIRRVALGTFISVFFENADTVRYQIQEMARVEKLISDEAIIDELNAYNPLVPEQGQLCATLFIELTSDESMREWLGRLVGIEQHLVIRLGDGSEVRAVPEEGHAAQLTRADVTSAVHYLRFEFAAEQVVEFERGDVCLLLDHPAYLESSILSDATAAELLRDLC
jgi:Protein of unknown function (DUF3501)